MSQDDLSPPTQPLLDREAFQAVLKERGLADAWVAEAAKEHPGLDLDVQSDWLKDIRRRVSARDPEASHVARPAATVGHTSRAAGLSERASRPSNQGKTAELHGEWPRWAMFGIGLVAITIFAITSAQHLPYFTPSRPAQPTVKEYRTAAGQRAKVTLPDSSTVMLAPESRITYAADFGSASNRAITLEGQALFTVTHSAGAPFVVRSGDIATRVLGTSFAIRRYPTDSTIHVIVAQGRVAVGSAVVGTGDVASGSHTNHIEVARGTDIVSQLAWTEGRLVFFRTPFRDVIPELERWYGIEVTVADPALLSRPVMTTLDTESAERALEVIAFVIRGRVERTGNHFIIHAQ